MVDLARIMSDVATRLHSELRPRLKTTLEAITAAAVDAVPGAEDAGITYVVDRSRIEARAGTGDRPVVLDALQDRLEDGPCYTAIREHATVRAPEVATDRRWPRFAVAARERGVGSMLTVQLGRTAYRDLGALNLYAGTPHAFDADSETVARIIAVHATVALAAAEREEHLETALRSRDRIGQAKGILMERHKITPEQAFTLLVRASTRTHRRLRDIADELATTGVLPAEPPDRTGRRQRRQHPPTG